MTFPRGLDLVLIGNPIMPIPSTHRIRHLGFLPDEDKFDALAASDLLIMPSYFESLSMVALEAWALGRPVLANGRCDVLKGQCIRSNAGLYYESYEEFARRSTRSNPTARCMRALGQERPRLLRAALCLAGHRAQVPRHVRAAEARAAAAARRSSRCPDGSRGAARCRPPRRCWPAAVRAPSVRGDDRARFAERGMSRAPRVHQVLATLGYGDAIGHEVLGIQRVLRGAGYESEIFVETADPRLEDLTLDYREMVGASRQTDMLIHHFSIGSRASRTAFALPGRMALVYHNITPPRYFVGVHKDSSSCASGDAASSRPTSIAAISRSATRNSTGRSSRPWVSRTPRCCPSSRISAT